MRRFFASSLLALSLTACAATVAEPQAAAPLAPPAAAEPAPLSELVKAERGVDVVQRGLSVEDIAVAVNPADQALLARLQVAQAELEEDGTLQRLRRKWLGNPYVDQSLGML